MLFCGFDDTLRRLSNDEPVDSSTGCTFEQGRTADLIYGRKSMKPFSRVFLLVLFVSSLVYGQNTNQSERYRSANGLAAPQFPQSAKVIQGPFVVGAGDNWAVLQWTTNQAGKNNSIVYAGTNRNDLRKADQTAEPVKMSAIASYQEQQYTHLVRLNHLAPGTTYYFVVNLRPDYDVEASSVSQLTTTKQHGITSWGIAIDDPK